MVDFSILIQNWFRQNSRNLPWRETKNPYFIWLSEVILQQTRVEQGLNYYLKFVREFPTVDELAKADEEKVLILWQGLGYYSRARNLHFAAKQVATEFEGIFPKDYKTIRSLKGVGDYTAAAISSIAYGQAYAVVDGNVYRVLSRYFAIEEPIDTTNGKKIFAEVAQELIDPLNPGDHNQAIMELGALVCLPKSPKCDDCPVKEGCLSYAKGTTSLFPVKSKKVKVRDRFFNYFVVTDGQSILIKKRGPKDIWQGLYDFPLFEGEEKKDKALEKWIQNHGWQSLSKEKELIYILTHQKIHVTFWLVETNRIDTNEEFEKIAINELEDYPLPQLLIRYISSSPLFDGE